MKSQLVILGTSHISKDSAKEIQNVVEKFNPDAIAVELDMRRLRSLKDRQKGEKQKLPLSLIRQTGVTGYLFLLIGSWIQKKLAGIVKVEPGVDMLAAVHAAAKHKKKLLLVDQDIMITMKNLRKQFTFKEKLRLVWDVIASPFQKQKLKIDLKKVPSKKIIKQLLGLMKQRYPGMYKSLLSDRNVHMCAQLDFYARMHQGQKILLVIGAGHEEDIRKRITSSSLFTLVKTENSS